MLVVIHEKQVIGNGGKRSNVPARVVERHSQGHFPVLGCKPRMRLFQEREISRERCIGQLFEIEDDAAAVLQDNDPLGPCQKGCAAGWAAQNFAHAGAVPFVARGILHHRQDPRRIGVAADHSLELWIGNVGSRPSGIGH